MPNKYFAPGGTGADLGTPTDKWSNVYADSIFGNINTHKESVLVSVGDTITLPNIPAGYFLECTTGGTTGATAPVVTPPVSAGQTITDGTVIWTVRQCLPTSGGVAPRNLLIHSAVNDAIFDIMAGNTPAGQLLLGGVDSAYAGQAILYGNDGTNACRVVVSPNNKLDFVVNALSANPLTYDLGGSAIVAKSLGNQNSYIKYASGFIQQWGVVPVTSFTNSGVGSSKALTLPISFANVSGFPITCCANVSQGGTLKDVRAWASCNATKIILCTNLTNTDSYFITWFAEGY